MFMFNMTNTNKDTITVHCIVERMTDAFSSLFLRNTNENGKLEETMDYELLRKNSLKTTNDLTSKTTNFLSDLLQKTLNEPSINHLNQIDSNKSIDEIDSSDNRDDKLDLNDKKDNVDTFMSNNKMNINNIKLENDKISSEKNCAMKINDESKSLTNLKNPLTMIAEMLRSKGQTNNYKIEDDFYAELPSNTPLQELVKTSLSKQGYNAEECSSAKGFIELRNWKPLTLEQISDDSETTIQEILGDISQIATLRVQLSANRSKSNSDFKDKLLQFLLTNCYGVLSNPAFSTSPELLNSFNSKLFDLINESNLNNNSTQVAQCNIVKELDNNPLNEEKLDTWYLQQLFNSFSQNTQQVQNTQINNLSSGGRGSVNSNSSNNSLLNFNSPTNFDLDSKSKCNLNTSGFSNFCASNRNSPNQPYCQLNGANSIPNGSSGSLNNQSLISPSIVNNNLNITASNQTPVSANNVSFPNRTRIRTSFDPEHELPKLHRWFAENQHPSRQQIQEYVRVLNDLESRKGRKPLDVNNVVYWFKNARAAHKRHELKLVNSGNSSASSHSPQQPNNGNNPLSTNELILAQFNQQQQRQLFNQLQLFNQHQNSSITDLLNSNIGKNALKKLMLKNAGIVDDELIDEIGGEDEEDEDQQLNVIGQLIRKNTSNEEDYHSKDSEEEENEEQQEENSEAFSNFAQTLDLSVKQSPVRGNLKRRKIDSTVFEDCEDVEDKDSTGSVSPLNQLSIAKRNNEINKSNLNSKQRFPISKQIGPLKALSHQVSQSNQQRQMLLDQENFMGKNENKDDNQPLVNSDGELDEENQESDTELDEKDYYTSMLNATMQNTNRGNSINQLASNIVGNNLAANFINSNYLQQTMNDIFVNRLIASQSSNAAAAAAAAVAANNSLLSSAAGLIAATSASNLANSNNATNNHLNALTNVGSNAFVNSSNNLLLNNPNSPEDNGIRRIRRSRTFIDPITEVPRLEQWFSQNTHPSHTQIVCYTEELNKLPYRQKFPKLESKNIQFWFKNRRAKYKRLSVPVLNGTTNSISTSSGQTGSLSTSSTTTSSITSQSNSQSDSPTPPVNEPLLCINGSNGQANREFVGRLVH